MSRPRLRGLLRLVATLLAAFSVTHAYPRNGSENSAAPLDPVDGIIAAFKTYPVVALGEGDHNNEQGHAIRLRLIRDPRFAKLVNDIVVEFGNPRYQQIMDRYVRGEDVPYASLRQAWQNTTQAHEVWDVPIYQEFFRTVRDVNAKLPKKRKLRVLLGDTPIDWDQVHSRDELRQVLRTDTTAAGFARRHPQLIASRRQLEARLHPDAGLRHARPRFRLESHVDDVARAVAELRDRIERDDRHFEVVDELAFFLLEREIRAFRLDVDRDRRVRGGASERGREPAQRERAGGRRDRGRHDALRSPLPRRHPEQERDDGPLAGAKRAR